MEILRLKKMSVKELCTVAMLVAITVILSYISGYLRIGPVSKFNISFISVYVAGAAFGPWVGGIVAAMADIVSFLANPTGPFMPWFTVIEFMGGFLFGLILFRGNRDRSRLNFVFRVVLCVVLQYLVNIIRTYMLAELYYGGKFLVTFVSRIPSTTIMAGVKIAALIIIEPFMDNIMRLTKS